MPVGGILSQFFNTKINLQRRTNSLDNKGDFTENWGTYKGDVPATIQPISISELKEMPQGKEYRVDSKAYIPLELGAGIEPLNGDRVVDLETGKTYAIVGVEAQRAARVSVTIGHHYKLILEIPRSVKT